MFHGQFLLKCRRMCCYRYDIADASERGVCSFPPELILPKMSGAGSLLKKEPMQVPPQYDESDSIDHMTEVKIPETGGL